MVLRHLSIQQLILKIKRRETWWARGLYAMADAIRKIYVPYCPPIHVPLYYEQRVRLQIWGNFKRLLYYEPLTKARCVSVGTNLRVLQQVPLIGGNLQIFIGDHVTIDGTNTFAANRVYTEPKLVIGDHSYIGWHVTISVGQEVTIGRHCLIGMNVFIADNDMHPMDREKRRMHQPVPIDMINPIHIGDDVWIGAGCYILRGVRIGDGAVIGAGSVVTHDIPANCVAAGNPARVLRQILSENGTT
jgi:acetyltransferase-like isoleucine patch superfamily enzyme